MLLPFAKRNRSITEQTDKVQTRISIVCIEQRRFMSTNLGQHR